MDPTQQQPNAMQAAQQMLGGQGGPPMGGNPQAKQQIVQLLQQLLQLVQQL